jgi:hypothetical protein
MAYSENLANRTREALAGQATWDERKMFGGLAFTASTVAMLLATVLPWSRFDPTHFFFQLWLILYAITPVLIPWLWWRNRATYPGAPEMVDVRVPEHIR